MTTLLWVGIGVALVILLAGIIVTLRTEKSLVDQRLERYLEQGDDQSKGEAKKKARASILTSWITQRIESTHLGEGISRELARADLKFKTGEYIALVIISSALVGLIGYFFGGGSMLFAIAGGVFGLFIPRIFVRRQQSQRLRKFNEQLPDTLNLMVNSLRSGFSALQAMEAVSQDLPAPISDEFRRVVQEMSLGVPMEGALENLQRRIASDDLDLTITAINIQREVGGNLAEILDTISYTIRERVRIKGEIRSATAQVTYSGRFLAVMPIILTAVLWALNRDYILQFFSPPAICGISMLVTAAVMLVAGYVILNRIGNVEI
ncbi:MAG: type II secretion system F family protein [Anaerolineales bacterium]